MKKRVAVLFGGRSPEHDVSVITGLQALQALDREAYEGFPVYIATDGRWLTGAPLARRDSYLPSEPLIAKLTEVTLDLRPGEHGMLLPQRSGLLGRAKPIPFDVALLAFHGLKGEDGQVQGLLEIANLPYTGMRTAASAVLMDKVLTKRVLASLAIPTLPYVAVDRPAGGGLDGAALARSLDALRRPWCVKPVHLGSSIGVSKVDSAEELHAVLAQIFRFDHQAMVEPFVDNLVEYNVAVSRFGGTLRTSAIERPKRTAELLDFREKYMSGGGKGKGQKAPGSASEGMLSLTREINPSLPDALQQNLRAWSAALFEAVNGSGAPRIDFMSNERTGEVWLNEANPCPGSFGFYLWEQAAPPLLFTRLLSQLIEEAVALQSQAQLPDDPTPAEARLLPRP